METPSNFGQASALYKSTGTIGGTIVSQLIKTGIGRLCGIMVSVASTSPTLTIYDSITASGTNIMAQFIPTAGTLYQFGLPVLFENGLFISSTGSVVTTVAYY